MGAGAGEGEAPEGIVHESSPLVIVHPVPDQYVAHEPEHVPCVWKSQLLALMEVLGAGHRLKPLLFASSTVHDCETANALVSPVNWL